MRWIVVLLSILFLEAGGHTPRPALDLEKPSRIEVAVFSMG